MAKPVDAEKELRLLRRVASRRADALQKEALASCTALIAELRRLQTGLKDGRALGFKTTGVLDLAESLGRLQEAAAFLGSIEEV